MFRSRGRARVSQPGGSNFVSVPQRCEGILGSGLLKIPDSGARGHLPPRFQLSCKLINRTYTSSRGNTLWKAASLRKTPRNLLVCVYIKLPLQKIKIFTPFLHKS